MIETLCELGIPAIAIVILYLIQDGTHSKLQWRRWEDIKDQCGMNKYGSYRR